MNHCVSLRSRPELVEEILVILGVVPLIIEVAVEVNAVAHVIFLFGTTLVWKPLGKTSYDDDNSTLESFC